MKKCLIFCVLSFLVALGANAEVYWEFQVGGMAGKSKSLADYAEEHHSDARIHYNIGAGINLFIPVSKSYPLLIETGLHWRMATYQYMKTKRFHETYTDFDYELDRDVTHRLDYDRAYIGGDRELNAIQIPVKLNYELRWSDWNSVRFGLGFYGRFALDWAPSDLGNTYRFDKITETIDGHKQEMRYDSDYGQSQKSVRYSPKNMFTVGITPSIVYSHRCVSFGISYETPVIYRGYKHNRFGNEIMFTFGLKFKSKAWKSIGMGIGAAALVAGGVSAAYLSAKQANSNSQEAMYERYNENKASTSSSTASSGRGSTGNSLSEKKNFDTDDMTYRRYDSMLARHFAKSPVATKAEVEQWQAAMKQLREKWVKRGTRFQITKVRNEDRAWNDF